MIANSQPVIIGPRQINAVVGKRIIVAYTAVNADGSPVTLSWSGYPQSATFDAASGIFSWTPFSADELVDIRLYMNYLTHNKL